jgi:hypothetical protein
MKLSASTGRKGSINLNRQRLRMWQLSRRRLLTKIRLWINLSPTWRRLTSWWTRRLVSWNLFKNALLRRKLEDRLRRRKKTKKMEWTLNLSKTGSSSKQTPFSTNRSSPVFWKNKGWHWKRSRTRCSLRGIDSQNCVFKKNDLNLNVINWSRTSLTRQDCLRSKLSWKTW